MGFLALPLFSSSKTENTNDEGHGLYQTIPI